jgi:mannose-6-phosphate isomerase-like protein (cupin superfamily)
MMNVVDSKVMTVDDAGTALAGSGETFVRLFRRGTLEVEIYRPLGVDRQEPHAKDELYVIIDGFGYFMHGNQRAPIRRGDTLFVRAGVPHRFEDFSPDFATWVFFYGPEEGD